MLKKLKAKAKMAAAKLKKTTSKAPTSQGHTLGGSGASHEEVAAPPRPQEGERAAPRPQEGEKAASDRLQRAQAIQERLDKVRLRFPPLICVSLGTYRRCTSQKNPKKDRTEEKNDRWYVYFLATSSHCPQVRTPVRF
jgi:hypothetical protein